MPSPAPPATAGVLLPMLSMRPAIPTPPPNPAVDSLIVPVPVVIPPNPVLDRDVPVEGPGLSEAPGLPPSRLLRFAELVLPEFVSLAAALTSILPALERVTGVS